MKKNYKCSYIPVLSKMAKATMLAFPVLLLTVNTANAADFPSFEDGEKYLNHIHSSVPGQNLMANSTFEICSIAVEPAVYVLDQEDDTDCTADASHGWSFRQTGTKGKVEPLEAIGPTENYQPPDLNDDNLNKEYSLKLEAAKESYSVALMTVVDVNEIYLSYDYLPKKVAFTGSKVQLELTPSNGDSPFSLLFDVEEGPVAKAWTHQYFAKQLDSPFTGTITFSWLGRPGPAFDYERIDNIFISTDVIHAASNGDGDGDSTPPIISLLGDAAVTLTVGDSYTDAGATANDDVDGTFSATPSGTVDNNTPGIYTLTYNAEDAAGNAATPVTRTVTVEAPDTTPPIISLLGDAAVTLTVGDSYTDAGATANDNIDGTFAATLSGTVDTTTLGTYTLTYNAEDAAGNAATPVTRQVNVILPPTNDDRDGDGINNDEDAFPDDASETVDTDGDGIGDNSDPLPNDPTDVSAPVFAEELALITLDAIGLLTDVEQAILDSNILAIDIADGEVASIIDTPNLMLVSGQHTISLSATDVAGNTATTDISVHIRPLVELGADVIVEAGSNLTVPVKLSGTAAAYPVVIDYLITTTIGETTGQVEIEQDGIASEFTVAIAIDAQAGDEVIISLTEATNAVITDTVQIVAHVKNENFAPTFVVSLEQGEQNISTISPNSGSVRVAVNISDINIDDEHSVSFEVVDSAFNGEITGDLLNIFTFDPTDLDTDKYQVKIIVTETNSTEQLSTEVTTALYVDAAQTEVVADSDQDGIPDADDTDSDTSRLPIDENEQPLQVQTGLKIVLGEYAQGSDSASIPADKLIVNIGFNSVSTITSFEVKGLNVIGDSIQVVLPLAEGLAIPEGAGYRKYTEAMGWFDFVEDNNNSLDSALKDDNGNCPAPASSDYVTGLVTGNNCIQLTIEDGGANDADGLANGIVVDPGVLVNVNSAPQISLNELMSVNENTSVVLNATVVDEDGDVPSYTWTQTAGQTVAMSGDNSDTLTFTAPNIAADETLTFTLSVSDGVNTTEETINVTLVDSPLSVTASADATSVKSHDLVTLTAIPSTQYSELLSYRWIQTGGDTVILTGADSTTATFGTPYANSTLTFEFTLTEGDKVITQSVSVDVEKKDSGGSGSFGTGILMFLAGLVGLRRKVIGK